MKIFFACPHSPNSTFLPESGIWYNNLYNGLTELGHTVVEFKYDLNETIKRQNPTKEENRKFIKKNRPKIVKELIQQIKEENKKGQMHLFFSYFSDACITREALDQIKSWGIKTVNWFCNASYQLYLVEKISKYYNFCLVPEEFRLDDYKRIGAKPVYCQEAADPSFYAKYDIPYKYDVTFVGQAYGERPEFIKYLIEHDVKVRVWGPRWDIYSEKALSLKKARNQPSHTKIIKKLSKLKDPQKIISKVVSLCNAKKEQQILRKKPKTVVIPDDIIGAPLSDTEMVKMYSRSKINLGFSSCATGALEEKVYQVRLRDFEVPMSGGFYLVGHMSELENFFENGREIVCYHDKKDLLDKIKYYLIHDGEREKIRRAGYKRARKDHTWKKRLEHAFDQMGLNI